jgi:3-oxoacyl-(acyl-carrier-protein) synthase
MHATPLLLITAASAYATAVSLAGANTESKHGGVVGLARVLRLEQVFSTTLCTDVTHGWQQRRILMGSALLEAITTTQDGEIDVTWCGSSRLVLRLRRSVAAAVVAPMLVGGSWLITGGLGGLGLRASMLLGDSAARVVLTSRSGRAAHGERTWPTRAASAEVKQAACDIADKWETQQLLVSDLPLAVLHAAGQGDKGLVLTLAAWRLWLVFSPKAQAAQHVRHATVWTPLEALVLFSSVASALGNVGQASYAAANASIDALALDRTAHCALVATSLQLPLILGAGMGEAAFGGRRAQQFAGLASISLEQYVACLRETLAPRSVSARCAVEAALPAAMIAELRQRVATQPRIIELLSTPGVQASSVYVGAFGDSGTPLARRFMRCTPVQGRAVMEAEVMRMVVELTGDVSVVNATAPLMEAGVDSLAATELSSRLQDLSGLALSPTLLFDHPTPRLIAVHMAAQLALTGSAAVAVAPSSMPADSLAALRLIGAIGRWPGGGEFNGVCWQLHRACGDAVGGVPPTRWTDAAVGKIAAALSEVQAASVRHGGFIIGVQRFANGDFGISPAESAAMDPQQRLLLEAGYEALHGAMHRRETLMGGDAAVLLGIERPDWSIAQPPLARASVYAVTSDNISVAAGRLCFVLGMQGPCASMDLACASSLVAVHSAARAVRAGECDGGRGSTALAVAVSLKLAPHGTLSAASAGMLSVDGRCKTLDVRANGYVRSEAVSALVLQPEGASDGCGASECVLVLDGSAARQDGRSASLTAPNGSAQRTLLMRALRSATVVAAEVIGIEAHGTGTALGDPTEAGAVAAVMGGSEQRPQPLVLSAAKGSVGHSEAASGQEGLLRVMTSMLALEAAGNSHLRVLNPLLLGVLTSGRAAARFLLPTIGLALRLGGGDARNVSSFGYSGTIAHAVLRSHGPTTAIQFTHPAEVNALFYCRHRFPWSDPSHPLLQQCVTQSNNPALFRSPTAGSLHALIAEHVVQGRVVFPGAAYLETARAAWNAAASSSAVGASLHDVFFLQPLAVNARSDGAVAFVECLLREGGEFEVRSGGGAAFQGHTLQTHCTGTASASALQQQLGVVAERRSGCAHAGSVDAQYGAFHAAGLQYGPSYRQLQQAWSCEKRRGDGAWRGAVARLRQRLGSYELAVHPADLDGALQSGAMLQPAGGKHTGETWLPFAVESALLEGGVVEQWAVRAHAPSPSAAHAHCCKSSRLLPRCRACVLL